MRESNIDKQREYACHELSRLMEDSTNHTYDPAEFTNEELHTMHKSGMLVETEKKERSRYYDCHEGTVEVETISVYRVDDALLKSRQEKVLSLEAIRKANKQKKWEKFKEFENQICGDRSAGSPALEPLDLLADAA